MKVHNIMEDVVIKKVNDMYEQMKAKKTPWLACDCEQCRLDTTSYVLNRVAPRYVVSGRGVNYNSAQNNRQQKADIDALIVEAIKIISTVQRPYHNAPKTEPKATSTKPCYNFPTFFGTIFDGTTFEPLSNAKVTIYIDGKIAEMIDQSWENPYVTDAKTKCVYSFLIKSANAQKINENKVFQFTVEATAEGYDKAMYSFSVPLVSKKAEVQSLNTTYSLKVQDLYLFPV